MVEHSSRRKLKMSCVVEVPCRKLRLIDAKDRILEKLSNTNDPKHIEFQKMKLKKLDSVISKYNRRH